MIALNSLKSNPSILNHKPIPEKVNSEYSGQIP